MRSPLSWLRSYWSTAPCQSYPCPVDGRVRMMGLLGCRWRESAYCDACLRAMGLDPEELRKQRAEDDHA